MQKGTDSKKCPRCGKNASFAFGPFCSYCGVLLPTGNPAGPSDLSEAIPAWETEKRSTAPVNALFSTIFEVIRHPDSFFRKTTARHSSPLPAMIFGIAAGGIGLLAAWFWSTVFLKYGKDLPPHYRFPGGEIPLPWLLTGAPLFLAVQMGISAGYIKIALYFSRLKQVSYSQIFRVLCYAESAMVLQIVPFLGTLAASVLWLYSVLTGLRTLYATSRIRILFSLLLPVFTLIALLLILFLAGLVGGIIAATGLLQEQKSILDWFK